jgi:predicted dehydrogenase
MINWGIIGCGNVTEVKSGPAFNKVSDSWLRIMQGGIMFQSFIQKLQI